MNKNSQPRLGVDFGRVIHGAAAADGLQDTVFLDGSFDEALASPATAGAFDVLPRLVDAFGGRVWVISKCGPRIQERTLAWLDHHDFYGRTGVPRGNVRFCRKRADKAGHCARLRITHMIDDRIDVHRALVDSVPCRYLFGRQEGAPPEWVRHTLTWADVEDAVIADL
ncbi:hypothetical protein [Actinophytocola algeriensis]|uniref:Nucleotidase n=1 Tax=Actinophytocola algeriensis TaxID=1768010 RepID=A0A7W7VDM6_9PSEU|nr:hypothetical protein [Actinophytocola algeriensis]MBB4906346.1 hypothetical protein [Actinophytocola algeriensis]MBE1477827.1 hypothetical protein [Actinophytocola algeriensis]